VTSGHHFKRIRHRRRELAAKVERNRKGLMALLSKLVLERFAQVSTWTVQVTPLLLSGSQGAEDPSPSPCHPACAEHDGSNYCRESWQLHLAELRRRPETLWHRCDYARLCAHVPILFQGRCIAVLTLACPDTTPEDAFERRLDILDVLARQFVIDEADFLGEVLRAEQAAGQACASLATAAGEFGGQRPTHPQVARAIRYIEENLSDPGLTVARVAETLDIHPHYLGSLFADQVGQRMNRFITGRRMEHAKTLLTTTPWQVKRIARETGHANTAWFCHLFSEHTGLTPGEYRSKSRRRVDSFQP
jgi:AraC-like DNA-binding protein